jgi:uncharacterized MAPEG superfamily protein
VVGDLAHAFVLPGRPMTSQPSLVVQTGSLALVPWDNPWDFRRGLALAGRQVFKALGGATTAGRQGEGAIPQGLVLANGRGGVSAVVLGEKRPSSGENPESRGKPATSALLMDRPFRASVANGLARPALTSSDSRADPGPLQQAFSTADLERATRHRRLDSLRPRVIGPAGGPASAPFGWSLVLAAAVLVVSMVPLRGGPLPVQFHPGRSGCPRAMFERLPAWGRRASWAHQNCYEAFVLHAPAALLCLLVGVNAPWAAAAALCHPCSGSSISAPVSPTNRR